MTCRFLTETDETPWRDCGYASWLMALDWAGFALPLGLTRPEREAFERADDRPDETGATLADLVTGTRNRYHLTYSPWKGTPAAFSAAMGEDGSGCLNLLYSALPAHFQRWDTHFAAQGFNSRHSVNAQRRSSLDRLLRASYWWLRDPLGRGGYCGEWIADADLMHAARAYGGGIVSALIAQPLVTPPTDTEEDMAIDPTKDIPAAICDVLPGGPLRAANKVTVLAASWPGGTHIGLYSRPVVTKGWAAIRIDRKGGPAEQLEIAWVPNNRVTNVRVT